MAEPTLDLLWQMEKTFWLADEAFYANQLYDDALMVFPQPTGVLDKAAAIASIAKAPRWQSISFSGQRVVRPHMNAAVLSYTANADRGSAQTRYSALASSVYAQVGGDWRLAFHQQTPIERGPGNAERRRS